jgi:alpha-beta hydrolase superfamily lysophospholipase
VPLTVWGPAEPAAVILAFHGYGDHGRSTFAAAAADWEARGIATLAVDQRGFGRSASRGRWPGAEALVADAVVISAQVRARYPCVPLIVVGHSMGGGIVLAAAAQGLEADGIVLAAPAIWGGKYLNPAYRAAAWTAAAVAPEHRFTGRGIVRIQASDNLAALRGSTPC